MGKKYNPYENTAIVSVREHGETSIVHKDFFDDNKGLSSHPRLILVNKDPIPENSIQQRHTTDSYLYCKNASLFGGSHQENIHYSSSFDAYQAMRGGFF